MVCQPLLLLRYVEFLYVVNQLLLESVLVIINIGDSFELRHNPLPYLLHTAFLIRLKLTLQCGDIVNLLCELALQSLALLFPELDELSQRLVDGTTCHLPFLLREDFHLLLRHDIRHTQKSSPVEFQRDILMIGYLIYLLVVILYHISVNRCG